MAITRPKQSFFSPIFILRIQNRWKIQKNSEFEQGVATYDPQAVGDAQRIARYTPIWYCPWVAVEP